MKTILCYGDSNTFGADPEGTWQDRFAYDVRWPGCLQRELGVGYRVIEEGLGGRTTVFDDPFEPARCGKSFLPLCLESHRPLDLVILMLGVNDLKLRFAAPPCDIALGLASLGQLAAGGPWGPGDKAPAVLLVSPAHIEERILDGPFGEMFGQDAPARCRALAPRMAQQAKEKGFFFFDAAAAAQVGRDGLHLTPESHGALARALAQKVKEILEA